MTDIDRIYEAALADEWEDRNRSGREIYPEWDAAIKKVRDARESLKDAVEVLKEAKDMVADSAEDDRISSLADEIGFLMKDLEKQAERMTA